MGFYDKIKSFFARLQSLPETKKKVIFFTIITIIFLITFVLGIISTKKDLPELMESLKLFNLPKVKTDAFDSRVNIQDTSGNEITPDQLDNLFQDHTIPNNINPETENQ